MGNLYDALIELGWDDDPSTEIDLDRDVPSGPIVWDGCGPNAGTYPGWEGWNVWDHEDENGEIVLTINPNNDEQLTDPENWSDEKMDSWFDNYCDTNPDFNDAMNGDYAGFDSFLERNLIA